MTNASNTHLSCAKPGCHPAGADAAPITCSPKTGMLVWPKTPMLAQATHDAIVKPTTHHLRRRRESEIAPRIGIDRTTIALAIAFAPAYRVFDDPRSLTI